MLPPLLFGILFASLGVVMLWLAARTFATDRAIARWPRAPGTIVSSRIESRSGTSRDQDGYDQPYTVHMPIVQFTYTVGDRVLQGDQVVPALVLLA